MGQRTDGFQPDAVFRLAGAPSGPLLGLSFAVKDVIDVAGQATSAGVPDWGRTHPLPSVTAACAQTLLDAGAVLVGKTTTDELCSSMSGINVHYGTPVNPAAAGRLPGGSSSGSAAVVAGGQCDFSLGTDTSGSVRLPAAYCGVFGYRPTHGRIPMHGVVALAPSFDTVGVMARDPAVLSAVSTCFSAVAARPSASGGRRLVAAVDAFAWVDREVHAALWEALHRIRGVFDAVASVEIHGGAPIDTLEAHCVLVQDEFHAAHQAWIDAVAPDFGPEVGGRMRVGERPPDTERVAHARRVRDGVRRRLGDLLTPGTVIALPTTFTVAPLVDTPLEALSQIEVLSILHGSVSALTGFPQVTAPWAESSGCPLGISLLAGADEDERLLGLVEDLHAFLHGSRAASSLRGRGVSDA